MLKRQGKLGDNEDSDCCKEIGRKEDNPSSRDDYSLEDNASDLGGLQDRSLNITA